MRQIVPVVLLGAFLVGCAREMTTPTDEANGGPGKATCVYTESCGGGGDGGGGGTTQTDPAPTQPGIWMSGVTPTGCFSPNGVGINDEDSDRMEDWCEQQFANKFRPSLFTSTVDCDLHRDPYYAVKYFPNHGNRVRVYYALAYVQDCGAQVPYPVGTITAHEGDSEFIVVDLAFDDASQHWYVARYFLSAHYNDGGESSLDACTSYSGCSSPHDPEWTSKAGGAFHVWVSIDKHANYRTSSECDAGAALHYDGCSTSNAALGPMFLNLNHNLGSTQDNLPNGGACVTTTVEVGRTGTECFWSTSMKFGGWIANRTNVTMAGIYGIQLAAKFECWQGDIINVPTPNIVVCSGGNS